MKDQFTLSPCDTEQKMLDAIRLRYIAYKNVGAIHENTAATFTDKYDLLTNCKTSIVYEGHVPVASSRACIYNKELDFLHIPAFEVYKDEIETAIGLDKTIIEANRFVIHPEKVDSKHLFKIPFRFIILNALKLNSEYILTAVRPKHIPVYRRIFGLEPISTPQKYPDIQVEMVMMAGECSALLPTIMSKEEVFRFTEAEVENYLFMDEKAMSLSAAL